MYSPEEPDPDPDPDPDLNRVLHAEIKEISWDDEDPADPTYASALVEFYIGHRGDEGADLYSLWIVTPRRLAHDAEPFQWGRHILIVDAFYGEETKRAIESLAYRYCRNTVGTFEQNNKRLSRFAAWEMEDLPPWDAKAPRPDVEARLIELKSPGIDLDSFRGDEHGDFDLQLQMRIGAVGSSEEALYEVTLCSPGRVASLRNLGEFHLFDDMAFMRRFDVDVLRAGIAATCARLKGFTAAEAIAKFGRYARRVSEG